MPFSLGQRHGAPSHTPGSKRAQSSIVVRNVLLTSLKTAARP